MANFRPIKSIAFPAMIPPNNAPTAIKDCNENIDLYSTPVVSKIVQCNSKVLISYQLHGERGKIASSIARGRAYYTLLAVFCSGEYNAFEFHFLTCGHEKPSKHAQV